MLAKIENDLNIYICYRAGRSYNKEQRRSSNMQNVVVQVSRVQSQPHILDNGCG